MLFSLYALDASEGDCLLLHFGTAEKPRHILIDGGPRGTYGGSLAPRLDELRELLGIDEHKSLSIDLAVLSHIDADHIDGMVEMVSDLSDKQDQKQPLPYRIRRLWFNCFDDVKKNKEAASIQSIDPEPRGEAVIASVAQGRALRDLATKLDIPLNTPFGDFVVRPAEGVLEETFGADPKLRLTVLSPTKKELMTLEGTWDKGLPASPKKTSGGAAGIGDDNAVPNLSSIALLAERDGRTMLLTGDARWDDILAGLEAAGKLPVGGSCEVDVFKLPHHGSMRNAKPELFERVRATTYVISADGENGNPDRETLDMLWEARGKGDWKLALTFPKDAYKLVDPKGSGAEGRRKALKEVQEWISAHPVKVLYRDPDAHGVAIDLGDEALG